MREKVRVSDLNILYVCLSEQWGTIERRCLADALYFRNIGGAPFIICYPKSLMHIEAQKQDIPVLTFATPLGHWRSILNFYFHLQQILQKQQIDIIHCYNYMALLPVGAVLRRMSHIPLLYTFNEFIPQKRETILDRWFLRRIDSILTFTENLKELSSQLFPISSRKIHNVGVGLEFPVKLFHATSSLAQKRIFIFISRTEADLTYLRFLVDAIPPIFYQIEQSKVEQKILITFLTDIPWYIHPIYDSLKRMVLERQLEMSINFETRLLSSQSFKDCDIYVGLPQEEPFSDIDLYALTAHTPVLIPRTSSRSQLVKQGKYGETYHPHDGREFKDKILKIILNYSNYMEDLKVGESEFIQHHNFEKYAEDLYGQYQQLYMQRLRYSQHKKKLA